MKLNTSGNPDLPYEKFLSLGPCTLSEAVLLAIILKSRRGLNLLHHISLKELMEIPGIGEVKAVKIKCIAELATRMSKERAASSLRFNLPDTVAEYYMESMRHQEKEIVLLLLLDNKLNLIEEYMVSIGTVNASLVSAREIFIQALKYRACHLMLLHNHPSGDPNPSNQDILITQKIKKAGELMDIPLIDHIIVGDGCYISLKEEHLI